MSMTKQTTETPKPKTPRKRRKRAKRNAAPAAKAPQELAGMTVKNCADACFTSGACIISGSVCAHPHKGGLQASLATPQALLRFNQAKRFLGKQKLNLEGLD